MIKKILVAIDFSDCSINALEHAITIAEKAKADVMMLWVNKPESAKEIHEGKPENLQYEINKRFNNLKKKYKTGLLGNNLLTKVRDGKVYREVVAEAEEWGADLIVAGTHGASGFEEFWVGSNAMKIVSATEIPVITIRGGVDVGRELKLIVLPIDSTPETRQKVPFTVKLAKYFNAEVHVLALHTTSIKTVQYQIDQYAKQAISHLKQDKVRCKLVKADADNVSKAMIDYAVEINANLIAITDEQEKSPMNLVLGPYAQQTVNHSPIPVLTVHSSNTAIYK